MYVFLKGAPERVLERCSSILMNGEDRPMDSSMKFLIDAANARFGRMGERVLAFAFTHASVCTQVGLLLMNERKASLSTPIPSSTIWSQPMPQAGQSECSFPAAAREAFCQRRGRCSTPKGPAVPLLMVGMIMVIMVILVGVCGRPRNSEWCVAKINRKNRAG